MDRVNIEEKIDHLDNLFCTLRKKYNSSAQKRNIWQCSKDSRPVIENSQNCRKCILQGGQLEFG